MKKNINIVLLGFEIFVCCILGVLLFMQEKNKEPVDIAVSDWLSDCVEYDNGWYVDDSIFDTSIAVDLLYGPYLELKRGTYSVTVDYETDFEQECELRADDEEASYIRSGTNKLVANQNSICFRFNLTEDVDNLEILVKYDGKGSLRINDIQIRPDAFGIQRLFVCTILLFAILNLCLHFKELIVKNRNTVFAVAGMVFLISLPLFMVGITNGHDLNVHFMRIEGIASELKRGNIPVKISSLWMDGYGYPISVYYGDLLLYIPAILRIIGFPVVTAYKIYVFLINAGTVAISYFCFRKIFEKNETACVVTLAYVTAGYRFVDVYVRAAVGEYSALMFLPVISLALYRMYSIEDPDRKPDQKSALLLTLGMTGLIGTHILSTEMVVFFMIIVCALLWKKTIQIGNIVTYLLAVLETLVLNLYFIIPFVDYYFNVDANINDSIDEGTDMIQRSGAYIGQYFAFFQEIFGLDADQINGRLGLTPGIVLMAALVFALVLWINKKASKVMKYLTVFSVIMLWTASDLFPWDHIATNLRLGVLLAQVQFPWRYISIAVVLLALLLGFIFQYYTQAGEKEVVEKLYLVTVTLCLVMSCYFVSDYCDNANIVTYYDTPELNTYAVGGAEYMRSNTDWVLYPNEIEQENMAEVSIISRKGYEMELYCKTSDQKGTVQVPLFYYKGYRVKDEYGNDYKISDGKYNTVKFSVPADFSGKITIDFVEPLLWRLGEVISLVFAVFLCLQSFIGRIGSAGVPMRNVFKKKEDARK